MGLKDKPIERLFDFTPFGFHFPRFVEVSVFVVGVADAHVARRIEALGGYDRYEAHGRGLAVRPGGIVAIS